MNDLDEAARRPEEHLLTRRRLFVAGVAGLVVGAAGAEAANLATSGPPPGADDAPPDVDLMAEHGVLMRVLLIYREALRRVEDGQAPPVPAVRGGAEIIHEFIESFHEALEEGYVFPRLRNAAMLVSTVDTLLVQHGRGREITQLVLESCTPVAMRSSTAREKVMGAVAAFVRMYEPHEAREDTVVFPAFRALLSSHELDDLAATFADLQVRQFGTGAFGSVVERVAEIERSIGIYDLNEFTPRPVADAAG